jgi:hypothetical protein
VISTAAALTVVLGALWEIRKLARRLWNDTIGSRRKQQRILNGLFPSANIQYIEELLGYATLVSRSDSSGSVRRYRLPDCWVSAGVEKDAVNWISVTVTDPKFVFRTNQLTQGLLSIRLGRDCFDTIDSDWFQRRTEVGGSIGQREWSYVEYSDGPTAHRSQKMIVAHIRVGVGQLATEGDPMSPTFVRESTTVNSFAVVGGRLQTSYRMTFYRNFRKFKSFRSDAKGGSGVGFAQRGLGFDEDSFCAKGSCTLSPPAIGSVFRRLIVSA